MINPIIVPLDGSQLAEQAVRTATTLALRSGRPLHLVSVHQTAAALSAEEFDASWDPRWLATTKEGQIHYLAAVAERIAAAGVDVSTAVPEGPVVPTLLSHIERREPWLVVAATHGRGGLTRFWLGSTVDQLLRELPGPLLVIRPTAQDEADHDRPIGRILVPLDGSPLAEQALEPARSLGALFDACYLLLRIVPVPYTIGSPFMPHSVQTDREGLRQRMEEATRYLDGVRDRFGVAGCPPATGRAVEDHGQSVATAILDQSVKGEADMIALATHGRGGLGRAILGSVADKLVRAATLPVLVVRPR